MRKSTLSFVLAAATAFAGAGCSNTPTNPSVSFTAPVAAAPANGTAYKFKAQPVTVSITNAVRTGPAPTTYLVEVATDPNFANKVLTKDSIPEGSGSTTSVTLSNLPAGSGDVTYYWRSTATVDGVASSPSPTQSFVVQQQIVLNAPAPSDPANGASTSELRPRFVTKNASRQGAVGTITYVFQVSTSANFSPIVATQTVTEQSGGQTAWTPGSDLPTGTLFWRAQARDDANTEASSFSNALSFVLQPFDPRKAIFLNNPPDVGSWPETTKITSIEFSDGYMLVDFDRRGEGSGAWPETGFGVQYTLGMCFNLNNQWYCSAPIQFWAGREMEASGPADRIGDNWYYDPARWGPMTGHQPADGELVAVWVGQGNIRGSTDTYRERSNFVLIPFYSSYHAPR